MAPARRTSISKETRAPAEFGSEDPRPSAKPHFKAEASVVQGKCWSRSPALGVGAKIGTRSEVVRVSTGARVLVVGDVRDGKEIVR